MQEYLNQLAAWTTPLIILAIAVLIGLLAHTIIYFLVKKTVKQTRLASDDSLARHFRGPSRLAFLLLSINIALPFLPQKLMVTAVTSKTVEILWIIFLAWLIIKAFKVFEDLLLRKYDITAADNVRARAIHTQFKVIQRIIFLIIVILALGIILLSFEGMRHIGTSLLASAGIAGIIIGFSAQKTLGTILAGIQIAFTQPIRIDDVLIVEGEWGRVEEITLTYVVVKIWDQRRLIVPITYFLENPFQNWTRSTSDILGTIMLYVDYTVDVEKVRQKLAEICEEYRDGLWDGNLCGLQVTDSNEKIMVLRGLVSASDASSAWNLRCNVREKLLQYLQEEYPDSLPKLRLLDMGHEDEKDQG